MTHSNLPAPREERALWIRPNGRQIGNTVEQFRRFMESWTEAGFPTTKIEFVTPDILDLQSQLLEAEKEMESLRGERDALIQEESEADLRAFLANEENRKLREVLENALPDFENFIGELSNLSDAQESLANLRAALASKG